MLLRFLTSFLLLLTPFLSGSLEIPEPTKTIFGNLGDIEDFSGGEFEGYAHFAQKIREGDLNQVKKMAEGEGFRLGKGALNPLHIPTQNPEITKYLIERGADPNEALTEIELNSPFLEVNPEVKKILKTHSDPEKLESMKIQALEEEKKWSKEQENWFLEKRADEELFFTDDPYSKLAKPFYERTKADLREIRSLEDKRFEHSEGKGGDYHLAVSIFYGNEEEEKRLRKRGFSLIKSKILPGKPYCQIKKDSEKTNMPNLPERAQDGTGYCYGYSALALVQQAYCEETKKGSCEFNQDRDDRLSVLDVIVQGNEGHLKTGGYSELLLEKLSGKTIAKESQCPAPWKGGDFNPLIRTKEIWDETTEAGFCVDCTTQAQDLKEILGSKLEVDEISNILRESFKEEETFKRLQQSNYFKNIENDMKLTEWIFWYEFNKKDMSGLKDPVSRESLEKAKRLSQSNDIPMAEAMKIVDALEPTPSFMRSAIRNSTPEERQMMRDLEKSISPEASIFLFPSAVETSYGDSVLHNHILNSKNCKRTEKLPQFKTSMKKKGHKDHEIKAFEETIDEKIEEGKLLSLGVAVGKEGSITDHVVVIQGKREICCEGECKKQYRIKDSAFFQSLWGYEDEWVDSSEVISRSEDVSWIDIDKKGKGQ